jgi:FixJ family two-component response regulator
MVIAIIDDDRDVRESTEFMLGLHGFETSSFASCAEFLSVDPSPFSFLLIDYLMPHMTGLDLLAELRRRNCAIPTAIMTASFSNEVQRRAIDLGVARVFKKPLSEDELVDVIKSAGA